jgi:MtN3 and saliva related transmembrane protein
MLDFLIAVLPNTATVLLVACYIPQIVHLVKTKHTEGLSIPFWVLLILALALFTLYNICLFIKFGVYFGIITEGANTILAIVVFALLLKYRKQA